MNPKTRLVDFGSGRHRIIDLPGTAGVALERLPFLHRILLENILRHGDEVALQAVSGWLSAGASDAEIGFTPQRILMHDTTCGPALVDIAAARSALAEAGVDPALLHPVLPVDVSTDHSVAVDAFAAPDALERNMATEMRRNAERYGLMKWASGALGNLTVHPPGTGIMHTINLERLATLVSTVRRDGQSWMVPDTLIGTDSHTPMISGIGVLAWGVGGLEAESVMFGQPVMMRVPRVVGVRLTGKLQPGVTATDLALLVTQRLRRIKLDGGFVEFYGPGVATLSAGTRATVANMAPEYGAATGYFPPDQRALDYLMGTGRSAVHVADAEQYLKLQKLWLQPDDAPVYAEVLEIDLAEVTLSLSGPTRPQDRIVPADARAALEKLKGPLKPAVDGVPDAAIAIAAITSCTNTSDPRLLVMAGLLAKKARALGLASKSWVKTSLAPGSPTAGAYLQRAGLLQDLEAIGFGIVGYGCTTCIGNSGALTDEMRAAMANGISSVAVLSGNRNFPGRVHAALDAAFLMSPPLVIAFALAGDAARDISRDPVGTCADGTPVLLADLWPSDTEIEITLAQAAPKQDYAPAYDRAEASPAWEALNAPRAALYDWDPASTYIRRPPFATPDGDTRLGSYEAVPLLVLGDDITTDHISPAGSIAPDSEAGRWLIARGENPADLNVFSSRRGNWEVMLRGLFTNRTVCNLLDKTLVPGYTLLDGKAMPLFVAADLLAAREQSVVIVAGARYGTGSSRDWAAKGAALLGTRAVLAVSFERIHRSNLVNMGVLPLLLPDGVTPQSLKLAPDDRIVVNTPADGIKPRALVPVTIVYADDRRVELQARADVETAAEAAVLAGGGMLPVMLRRKLRQSAA